MHYALSEPPCWRESPTAPRNPEQTSPRPPGLHPEWPDRRKETFELTDGSTPEYQKRLTEASRDEDHLVLPVDINTPEKKAAQLWAEILFSAFLKKAEDLRRGRFDLDHLLIYDLTGLGLLVPLERGGSILRQQIREWYARELDEIPWSDVVGMRNRLIHAYFDINLDIL